MARNRTFPPDLTYGEWHRPDSICRFLSEGSAHVADALALIDIDCTLYLEYDDRNKEPLALIETARDIGQQSKPATVTRRLAQKADLPAFTVLYKIADSQNPAYPSEADIESFRVQRLHPKPERTWRVLSPSEYLQVIKRIRHWQTARIQALP